jgi:hypothetical protein
LASILTILNGGLITHKKKYPYLGVSQLHRLLQLQDEPVAQTMPHDSSRLVQEPEHDDHHSDTIYIQSFPEDSSQNVLHV